MNSTRSLILIFALVAVPLDQILKWYFVNLGIAEVNNGISFDLFSNLPINFHILIFSLLSIVFYLLSFKRKWHTFARLPASADKAELSSGMSSARQEFTLIYMGGLDNLIDRVIYGGVVDYINFFGLFKNNLGDIMIFVGFLMFIFTVARRP